MTFYARSRKAFAAAYGAAAGVAVPLLPGGLTPVEAGAIASAAVAAFLTTWWAKANQTTTDEGTAR